jgi:phosphoribosylpyrophosphate synthetase
MPTRSRDFSKFGGSPLCFHHFHDYIKSLHLDNLTIASPDMGGAKRAPKTTQDTLALKW